MEGSPRPDSITRLRDRDSMANPESPYLQEHLLARRSNSKRSRRSDFHISNRGADDDLFMAEAQAPRRSYDSPSSRTTSKNGTPTHGRSSTAHDVDLHKNLGARELDKHLDRLNKLNFDLKMDLYHSRERVESLQKQCIALTERAQKAEKAVEEFEALAQEKKALVEINDDMIIELEKRDEAVKEAVTIICELEEKVETLERQQSSVQPWNPHANVPQFNSPQQETADRVSGGANMLLSPPLTTGRNSLTTPETPTALKKRVPSFMSDKKPSTNALRSVYLEPASKLRAVQSYASLLSQREGTQDGDGFDSPHLSVLSESSFPSIYSPKKPSPTQDSEGLSNAHTSLEKQEPLPLSLPGYDRYRNDNSRISEWVASRITKDVPSRQLSQRYEWSRQETPERQFQSLDDPVVYAGLQDAFEENASPIQSRQSRKDGTRLAPYSSRKQATSSRLSLGVPVFGEGNLPPTPESVSIRLLRDSRSSLADNRTNMDSSKSVTDTTYTTWDNELTPIASWGRRGQATMLSEEDTESETESNSVNAVSGTIGHVEQYHTIPDGASIITGTPSRFQARHCSPPAREDDYFDGDALRKLGCPSGSRMDAGTANPNVIASSRPDLPRAETSPLLLSLTTNRQRESIDCTFASSSQPHLARPTPGKRRMSDRLGVQRSPFKTGSKSNNSSNSGMRASITHTTQKLFRRLSDARETDPPASTRMAPALPSAAQSSAPQTSPKRPRTAHPIDESGFTRDGAFSRNIKTDARRPLSHDSDLAMVAANQALSSRRQSHQPPPTQSSTNMRFFKRTGSGRR